MSEAAPPSASAHPFPAASGAEDSAKAIARELRSYLALLRGVGAVALAPGAVIFQADAEAEVAWPDESPQRHAARGGSGQLPDESAALSRGSFTEGSPAVPPASEATRPAPPAAPPKETPILSPPVAKATAPVASALLEPEEQEPEELEETIPTGADAEADAEIEAPATLAAAAPELAVPPTSAPLPASALVVPELLAAEAEPAAADAEAAAAPPEDPAQLDLFGGAFDLAPPPDPEPKKSPRAKKGKR